MHWERLFYSELQFPRLHSEKSIIKQKVTLIVTKDCLAYNTSSCSIPIATQPPTTLSSGKGVANSCDSDSERCLSYTFSLFNCCLRTSFTADCSALGFLPQGASFPFPTDFLEEVSMKPGVSDLCPFCAWLIKSWRAFCNRYNKETSLEGSSQFFSHLKQTKSSNYLQGSLISESKDGRDKQIQSGQTSPMGEELGLVRKGAELLKAFPTSHLLIPALEIGSQHRKD